MEVPEFNIEQDEAFAARMQLGLFLGDVKNWAVTLGQLPYSLAELLHNWDKTEGTDDIDAVKATLVNTYEFVAQGLTALINLIQAHATKLYGEPFGNDDFKYEGQELAIRSTDEVEVDLKNMPREVIEQIMSSDGLPDVLKEIIQEMLDNQEGEENE